MGVNDFAGNAIGEFRHITAPLRQIAKGQGCIDQSITEAFRFAWVVE